MSDIKIFPIFNQAAPQIWDDFISIRAAALEHNYKFSLSPDEDLWVKRDLKRYWSLSGAKFAFAAYDINEMIGFARGGCFDGDVCVYSLYVRPEYQGRGVGRRLLTQVERIIGAKNIELISLAHAVQFYCKMGYSQIPVGATLSNNMLKQVAKQPACTVVPMFYALPNVRNRCREIASAYQATFDYKLINQEHATALVYFNEKSEITAYGIQEQGALPEIHVAPHNNSPRLKACLEREFMRLATMPKPQKTK